MKINRKLELVKLAIDGIATHDQQDRNVLFAALDKIKEYIDDQKVAIDAKIQAEIDEALGESEED